MTQTLPISVDAFSGDLPGYIRSVNNLPVLTAEDERALAIRYREDEDLDAARELVLGNLRHVVHVARKFAGYGLPLADLIQEGNIGLMKAVKRYDPARDVRLVSFAVHWVRSEIYDYVLRNWRIAKVATTKAQRKLFFNLRKNRTRLGWMNDDEVKALAKKLDVSVEAVREMEGRMSFPDVAFDTRETDDEDSAPSPEMWLADDRYSPEKLVEAASETDHRNENLRVALEDLDDRSRDIIESRWLDQDNKSTLHELADKYGVSAERIRQIEKRAMGKMKDSIAA